MYSGDSYFITPKPKEVLPLMNFLTPFSLLVWLVLLGATAVTTIVSFLLIRYHEKKIAVTDITFDFFGTIWGQSKSHEQSFRNC